MMWRKKSILITTTIVGTVLLVLILNVLLSKDNEEPSNRTDDHLVETDSEIADDIISQTDDHHEATTSTFMTDTNSVHVLWEQDEHSLFVHNLQLYYSPDGTDREIIHTWEQSWPAQAWLNGDYLLIGTQVIDKEIKDQGRRGAWLAVHIESTPTIVDTSNQFFGPEEVLAVTVTTDPYLFIVAVPNGSAAHYWEYLFDPHGPDWKTVSMGNSIADLPVDEGGGLHYFDQRRTFHLPDDVIVYSFEDERGSVVYHQKPFFLAWRYNHHTLQDVKRISFLDGYDRILGKFRNQLGEEKMILLKADSSVGSMLSVEPRLWEDGWQALDERTFIRQTSEKLDVLKYEYHHPPIDDPPEYIAFSTAGSNYLSTEGTLLEYERGGDTAYISWFDLINSVDAEPASLWATPLDQFTIIEEPRPTHHVFDHIGYHILAWEFEEDNTNEPVPDELRRAISELFYDSDYGFAKTYRQISDTWYVLIDFHLYEYRDESLVEIGEVPITHSVRVGEGFEGRAARDFVRIDEHWIIADTEASRLIKLDDQLNLIAELHIPTPNSITIEGDKLLIIALAQQWKVDADLNVIAIAPQDFSSANDVGIVEHEYFSPHEWFEDTESGLTWYYLFGNLYQYNKQKQQYRSFFIGYNENDIAKVQIHPYKDEIIVMMDRRLERFDREGNWQETIVYPRSGPDGIYTETPSGENSLIIDDSTGVIYLVQGYRILAIDLLNHEVKPVFRQNFSQIGKLHRHGDHLYFMLHSDAEDRWRMRSEDVSNRTMYTEIVKIDMHDHHIQRYVTEGYYESLELVSNTDEDQPQFTLKKYTVYRMH